MSVGTRCPAWRRVRRTQAGRPRPCGCGSTSAPRPGWRRSAGRWRCRWPDRCRGGGAGGAERSSAPSPPTSPSASCSPTRWPRSSTSSPSRSERCSAGVSSPVHGLGGRLNGVDGERRSRRWRSPNGPVPAPRSWPIWPGWSTAPSGSGSGSKRLRWASSFRFLARRVLVVEDEAKMAALLKRGLEHEGDAVDLAADGGEALWAAREFDFDAIVLDAMIPPPDGFEVCRTLRSEGRWTPVLLLTARDGIDDRVLGLDAGADDYLTKPFEFNELFARLRAL